MTTIRKDGRLRPRHGLWAGRVRGWLFISEEQDSEVHRTLRVAKLLALPEHKLVMPRLMDAIVILAKPDLWTITGWEQGADAIGNCTAYAQSWLMIPATVFDAEHAAAEEANRLAKLHQADEAPIKGRKRAWGRSHR